MLLCLFWFLASFTSEPRSSGVPRSLSFCFFALSTSEPRNLGVSRLVFLCLLVQLPWNLGTSESRNGVLSCVLCCPPRNSRVLESQGVFGVVYLRTQESQGTLCFLNPKTLELRSSEVDPCLLSLAHPRTSDLQSPKVRCFVLLFLLSTPELQNPGVPRSYLRRSYK